MIGSGVAGLSYALKVADRGRVLLVTKSRLDDTNTYHAQGGIASVTYAPDDFEQHIEDTMVCGSHKNNREVVELVVDLQSRIMDGYNEERLGTVDQGYEQVEQRAWLDWVMGQVTPQEKRLLELRYMERMGQRETARHLGVSQMQVSRMERRILARLREISEPLN